MFSALRQHSTLYILIKSNPPKLIPAQVEGVSEPQTKMGNAFGAFGQNYQSTVNIVACDANGDRYEFPDTRADLSIENKTCNGTEAVISESREAMLSEVKGMRKASQNVLDSMPYHNSVVEACTSMESMLDPQQAKDLERDKEMLQLRSEMNGLKGSIDDIKNMLDRALNTKNNISHEND